YTGYIFCGEGVLFFREWQWGGGVSIARGVLVFRGVNCGAGFSLRLCFYVVLTLYREAVFRVFDEHNAQQVGQTVCFFVGTGAVDTAGVQKSADRAVSACD
ncbi:hypothetical protein, partial [Enterobacter hormaechei]